jgi:hypothetical protein
MKILKIIFLIGIILLVVSFIQKDKLSFSKNEVVEELFQEPIQTEINKDEFKVSREGMTYTITPLFNYELYGLVVSYNNSDHWFDYYHDRWQDFINTKDICVIWGDNIDSEVYKAMKFKNGSLSCHATFKFRTEKAIRSKFKPNCLSNNHLLSDNEEINKILKRAKTGDQIYLKGYLAEYSNDKGWYGEEGYDAKRGTSVTRDDYLCETIYITDFKILKRTNIFWHYTYDFSKYLIICCFIFGIIKFFFLEDFLRKRERLKQKEIIIIDKKGGFMKKPTIVILILLSIIGCAGVIFATGNFDKIVDKVFTNKDKEDNFDGILEKIKENLDKVESVHAEEKGNFQTKIGESESIDFPKISDEKTEINFIFPDKKSIDALSLANNGEIKPGVIIIGKNIYIKLSWISNWIHGTDGQSMPMPIPDTPGDYLSFDLSEYPEGWDFTRNIEKIKKYLGTEEINGIKCYHYKVKTKKIPVTQENLEEFSQYFFKHILGFSPSEVTPFKKEDVLKLEGDHIRYMLNGEEILVPLPESLTLSPMYLSAEIGGNKIETWAIDGEIWVGQDDFLVYKENYTKESSCLYYDIDESGKVSLSLLSSVFKNDAEITYSNFNGDIKIEAPTENVITIKDYLADYTGYSSIEEYEKEQSSSQVEERDQQRKDLLYTLTYFLKNYYKNYNEYPITKNLEKVKNPDSNLYKTFMSSIVGNKSKILLDPKDPEYWYGYKSDGKTYELTARLENLEDESCATQNGVCLYKCKDGKCGIKE